jgi:hypothetical protein
MLPPKVEPAKAETSAGLLLPHGMSEKPFTAYYRYDTDTTLELGSITMPEAAGKS